MAAHCWVCVHLGWVYNAENTFHCIYWLYTLYIIVYVTNKKSYLNLFLSWPSLWFFFLGRTFNYSKWRQNYIYIKNTFAYVLNTVSLLKEHSTFFENRLISNSPRVNSWVLSFSNPFSRSLCLCKMQACLKVTRLYCWANACIIQWHMSMVNS